MSAPLVEKIANAVLYEGYLLYPYRSSAVKNRQRWNFGVIYPRAYSETQGGSDPFEMETQCLAAGSSASSITVKVRFLRLTQRIVGSVAAPFSSISDEAAPAFDAAESIEIDGQSYESWQEAAEAEISLAGFPFTMPAGTPARHQITFAATRTVEPIRNGAGVTAGLIVRTQEALQCRIDSTLDQPQDGLFRITIRISNETPLAHESGGGRDAAVARSLLSAHTILHIDHGEFVSLLEPPPQFEKAAAACRNVGTWPVLAGDAEKRDTMLSSPIILYDYPQVAPESPGDLFDGAEIDEILSLRILALTDEEKAAMRRSDERARHILERTEMLPPVHFMKLHGALRKHSTSPETS